MSWAQVVNNALEALVIIALCGMLTYCITTSPVANPCGIAAEGSKRDG